MPKLRKQRRRQKYMHDRNRKRIKKSHDKYKKDNIKVTSDVMKEHWDHKESIRNNLEKMGVAFDANKVISCQKSTKEQYIERIQEISSEKSSVVKETEEPPKKKSASSSSVITRLEAEAAEANANKKQTFRFPKEQVRWITYCIDKHGDDFKAMAKDPKNIWQETPKQIRQKVLKFISIPEHFDVYANERGLLE